MREKIANQPNHTVKGITALGSLASGSITAVLAYKETIIVAGSSSVSTCTMTTSVCVAGGIGMLLTGGGVALGVITLYGHRENEKERLELERQIGELSPDDQRGEGERAERR